MIAYYTTTLIHLSLEDYHNAGLTPEETREIIESIADPGSSSLMLSCEPAGINHNWNVRTMLPSGKHNHVTIGWLVYAIENRLREGLQRKIAKLPAAAANK